MVMSEKNKYYINSDISKARTLNAGYYTSDRIFNSSINSIFTKSWQLICHKNELEDSNIIPIKFLPDFISEPLVITKQNESIYCVSNVCTHRGHMVCSKKNLGKSIICSADLTLKIQSKTNIKDLISIFHEWENKQKFNIFFNNTEPLVSLDLLKSPYSAIIDNRWTEVVNENLIKIVLWYDNEWGYSSRVVDQIKFLHEKRYK